MRFLKLSIVFCLALWVIGCTTVSEPDVIDLPSEPAVSPVLQDDSYTLKRKVTIARFSNETLYGKSVLLEKDGDLLGKQASDVLATRLAETGEFLLFERSNTRQILDALDRGKLHDLRLPADFLVVGSVSEFGRETVGKSGILSRSKEQKAVARVNVRLVDCSNSQVIFACEGSGEAISETGTVLGIGTREGYNSSLNDRAISAAITKVVSQLVENLRNQPWRSYVLVTEQKHDGDYVTIGGGRSQGLAPGHRLALLKRGKTAINPQTGAIIELPGEKIATVKVIALFGNTPENEIAQCRIISGSLPMGDFSQYIVEEDVH